MSDISDVQSVLVGVIAGAVYPNGTAAPSVSGHPIVVYAGWPAAGKLDPDLAAGKAHITVFQTATETNKTRYSKDWQPQGATGKVIRELRRQDRIFQITIWASTPAQRDAIGSALDVALAQIEFLVMPDGLGARLIYRNSHVSDDLQKAKLYRRDFQYSVEYATTQTMDATAITQTTTNVTLSTT